MGLAPGEGTMTAMRTVGVKIVLVLAAFAWTAMAAADEHGAAPHWTYEGEHGPAHWGSLEAAYEACKLGKHQSPIDIRAAKAADLPAIAFSYQPSPLKVIDN